MGNPHVMTVFAWAHRRAFPDLPEPESRLIPVSADTQVLAHCHWQPERQAHPTLLALHGLEGSSAVHYMRGLADKARRLGWNVVLLNQRNCGGTEHLTPSLYHSGLTDDPRAVIRSLIASDGLTAFAIVGYSLGGNLAMKLTGELDDHPDLPILATVAICPTMDLTRCVAAIERRRNVIYEFNFVRNLKARMRRKERAWPGTFDLGPLDRIRTIREFDDRYTAHSTASVTRPRTITGQARCVSRIAFAYQRSCCPPRTIPSSLPRSLPMRQYATTPRCTCVSHPGVATARS
jgi:predicted alpha/beta-fold hydrolase